MTNKAEVKTGSVLDHYSAVLLFLALFILTFIGIGSAAIVALLGLILCAAGITQRHARVDLWIFAPLLIYNGVSMASSYAAYGSIADGFASTQMIIPVIYLFLGCLDNRDTHFVRTASIAWATAIAAGGIGCFTFLALVQGAIRLEFIIKNPNALGIFLVISWFALADECDRHGKTGGTVNMLLHRAEPILLVGMALTLSMGSFISMAAGIVIMALDKTRRASLRETLTYLSVILAKASLCFGVGVLMYVAADKADAPWMCVILAVYTLLLTICWHDFENFLHARGKAAGILSAAGVLVATIAVIIRPSAVETFQERLEMMRSGLSYIGDNLLLGVGPYKWRQLDFLDGGKYFDTWHIHNVFIHIGTELGVIAAAMLVVITVRYYRRKGNPAHRAGFTAFFIHNLIDTSYFYLGIVSMLVITAGEEEGRRTIICSGVLKMLFGVFAVMFAYFLYDFLT